MKSATEGVSQRLAGASFYLSDDPSPGDGFALENGQQDGFAYSAKSVKHDRLSRPSSLQPF
jgi:hypothetical protein